MTEQEITTIVERVLSALLTSGKTIAQLTAVQSVGDSDCFELSGGKKVSYETLLEQISEAVGDVESVTVVDYDGRDEVTTFSYTASSGIISLKQRGRSTTKTITISTATTSRPGLMSATDKTNLATVVNKVVSALAKSRTSSSVDITLTFADNTSLSLTLPVATASYAGLMSASDKLDLATAKNLANSLNNKLGAASGIATLDSNGKLNASQLPSNVITDLDMYSFVPVDAAGYVNANYMQRNVLFNVDTNANLSGLVAGDIFFEEGSLFCYEYTNNHGSRIASPVGDPQANIMYFLKGTGEAFKWNTDNSCFVPARPQMLNSMGSTLDDLGSNIHFNYVPVTGHVYFNASESKIYYMLSDSVSIDLGAPNKQTIYTNIHTNRLYRWSGTAMVEVGNN